MSDVSAYLDPPPPPGSMAPPEAVWAQAKEDYLGGESAGAVCQRYSLSRSRFFERAKAQGWRRRDRDREREEADDRAAYDAEADAAFVCMAIEAPATPAYQLARRAWAVAERAILMRRRIEPAGWARVARDLRRAATEEVGAVTWSARSNAANRSLPPKRGEPSPGAGAAGAHPAPAPRRVSRMSGATRRPTRLRNAFC